MAGRRRRGAATTTAAVPEHGTSGAAGSGRRERERERQCAMPHCERYYVRCRHKHCCSMCSVGQHTARCDDEWRRYQERHIRAQARATITQCVVIGHAPMSTAALYAVEARGKSTLSNAKAGSSMCTWWAAWLWLEEWQAIQGLSGRTSLGLQWEAWRDLPQRVLKRWRWKRLLGQTVRLLLPQLDGLLHATMRCPAQSSRS